MNKVNSITGDIAVGKISLQHSYNLFNDGKQYFDFVLKTEFLILILYITILQAHAETYRVQTNLHVLKNI